MNNKIGIVMGSDSDFPAWEKAVAILNRFGIGYFMEVTSAHRTPQRTLEVIAEFERSGVGVVIAAAGGAAHLPGVVAAHTTLPVLGVPMDSNLQGLDSLYSIVQMPAGIPVATFGIGAAGAQNAVLFAIQVLALNDPGLASKIEEFRAEQSRSVLEKSRRLREKIGLA